jgi:class 3 adenylate cyclase/tetratricopeptide (TPR) repeat protein/type II secretory pathway predicted ATPase ExeA
VATSELVTIVFTDLVGSTELGREIGDPAADELRRTHFQVLRDAIAATGGTEVKTIGDALMVSYGSAADAVDGAVAMQRGVERQGRADGHPLAMRVGMSAGDATCEDGDWFGAPVVEAARLCSAAAGGQILVADIVRVLAGSRTTHDLRPVGEIEAKGIPDPIAACEVAWDVLADEPAESWVVPLPPLVEHGDVFPFAGRAEQRDLLVEAWKSAAAGHRRLVLVSGEPGIGKTRLVKELARLAHDEGGLVLWGGCDEELAVPYQPITEALRWFVHSTAADQLRDVLGPLAGELTRLVPDLVHLVPGLEPPIATDPDIERFRLFEAVVDTLTTVAARAPVLLVVDDAHWATKPTLLLLRHLLKGTASSSLLVVVTYRDTDLDRTHPLADVLADLRRDPDVERLALTGLDEAGVTDFLERTAGHRLDEPAQALVQALHAETEGNPFFLGEVLRHLAESGVLVQRDGRWTSDVTLDQVGIPEGVKEVIGRRLSRLDPATNELLAAAAVVGREFDVGLLTAVSDRGQDAVLDAIEAAEVSGLVIGSSRPGAYRFAHALVSSTLYGELPTSRRIRWHRAIARVLVGRADADDRLPELARHFSEAAPLGEVERAVHYCQLAGDRAQRELAFEEAAAHYERALLALELDEHPDPATTSRLLLALGGVLGAILDPRARELLLRATDSARSIGDTMGFAEAAIALGRLRDGEFGRADQDRIALLEEALAGLDETEIGPRARLLAELAFAIFFTSSTARRLGLAREALDLARRCDDRRVLAQVLDRQGVGLDLTTERALETLDVHTTEMLSVAEDLDDPVLRCRAHFTLTTTRTTFGARTDAEAHLEAGEELAAHLRLPDLTFRGKCLRAAGTLLSGRLDDAEALIDDFVAYGAAVGVEYSAIQTSLGFRLAYERGALGELLPLIASLVENQPAVPVWRVALMSCHLQVDQHAEALAQVRALAADDFAMVPRDNLWVVTVAGVARVAGRLGELDIAAAASDHALPHIGELAFTGVSYEQPVAMSVATAYAALGRWDEAEALFGRAVDLSRRADAPTFGAATRMHWATALLERGDPRDRERVLELAGQALTTAEHLGLGWVEALSRRVLDAAS